MGKASVDVILIYKPVTSLQQEKSCLEITR